MNRLSELQLAFRRFRFPSTTARLPRNLALYSTFKANEMRILLLFGHAIFKNVLKEKYYSHLLKLVLMMHLSENRKIHYSYLQIIKRLGQSFTVDFSRLYTKRHCVQVIHSINHISDTVRDFGPLSNFTTFQFENELGRYYQTMFSFRRFLTLLGLLTRATKGTRRHALELISNLHLMQQAYCYFNNDNNIDTNFRKYLSHLSGSFSDTDTKKLQLRHPIKHKDKLVSLLFSNAEINCYNTLHIGRLRLCTRSYAEQKVSDDSNITFLLNGEEYPGRIRSIFTFDNSEPYLLVAYLSNLKPFNCDIDTNGTFSYPFIKLTCQKNWNFIPISVTDFVEKIVFFDNGKGVYHFFRYPTLEHCS